MQDVKKIAEMLQDKEITLLKALYKNNSLSSLKGLSQIEFVRAGMWLENKGLVKTKKTKTRYVVLDEFGKKYLKTGLPELQLLSFIKKKNIAINDLKKHFASDEATFILGYVKKKCWVDIDKGVLKINSNGKKIKETLESRFLNKLAEKGKLKKNLLRDEDLFAYTELRKRKKIIKEIDETEIIFEITSLGKSVYKNLPKDLGIGVLTSQDLKSGIWKGKRFRRYDVSAGVPRIVPGMKQRYLAFLDELKNELVAMGFMEMQGPVVESTFFNNDALFMPQDHPARATHDIYSIDGSANLSEYTNILKQVINTHENGGKTGSKGWGGKFSEQVTKKLVLRSQTTAVSARTLASKELKIPGKYFCIGRCYRPDVIDATHLTEFNQLEGIIIGKDLNFSHLLGMLAKFASKMAGVPMDKIMFLPGYFPFTEPSVECFIYSDELKKWIEVMPAGILRPEVTEPLGVKESVLAWGFGAERIFMIKEKIGDIRTLFSQDLDWLRGKK